MSLIERYARHDVLVVSADGAAVVKDAEGRLPRTWTDGAHPADVSSIVRGVSLELGQAVSILRCLRSKPRPDGNTVHRWWLAELLSDMPLPAGRRWVPVEALPDKDPLDGREWQRRGWATRAHEWLRARVPGVAEIEQIRCWEFSYVARVTSQRGVYYFKALPHSYAYEPALTHALAASHPRLLPTVEAIEPRERWMLTRAAGGVALERRRGLEPWLRTVAGYADLQRTWASRTEELRALGCRQTEPALNTDWAPHLWQRLTWFDIPPSIDHGDFWPSNVFVTPARSRIIDWTDAAIGQPFFSLLPMRLAFGFDRRRTGLEQLCQAYIEPWGVPREAFDLAQPLGALYYATKLQALPQHEQWWLPRFVPWLMEIANREAATLVW